MNTNAQPTAANSKPRTRKGKGAAPGTDIATASKALRAVAADMNETLLERSGIIRSLMLALLARQHILLLGLPGTAKSMLANWLTKALTGATCYAYQLTAFSTPEDLFGPIRASGLMEDKYERKLAGRAAAVSIFFADEIWKATEAILNALLGVLNPDERAYDNDGKKVPVPLEICIGASNELPQDDSLAALYDRFMLRHWIEYLTPDSLRTLLVRVAKGERREPKCFVSVEQIRALQDHVRNGIDVPEDVIDRLIMIRQELAGEGVVVSDRAWCYAVTLAKASAALDGRAQVCPDDLGCLVDSLWREPQQRPTVVKIVARQANPITAQATKCLDMAQAALKSFPETVDSLEAVATIMTEVKQQETKVAKAIEGQPDHLTRRASECLEEITSILNEMRRRTLAGKASVLMG